jgi:hypothetical protein
MADAVTRVGLRGDPCGTVDAAGVPRLGAYRAPFAWQVAASDRWHDPRGAASVRQRTIDGTPVVETKLAVPGGDIVSRAYAVADQGGALVCEFENRSSAAVVVAVPMRHASTSASGAGTAPHGVEMGSDARAFPLAHSSTVRFAWPASRPRWGRARRLDVASLASADAVVRGWVNACEKASRVSFAAQVLAAARCTMLLAAAREIDELFANDPVLAVLCVAERVRMGEPAGAWLDEVVLAAEAVARSHTAPPLASRTLSSGALSSGVLSSRALSAAVRVLSLAGEDQAAHDASMLWRGFADTSHAPDDSATLSPLARAVADAAAIEARLVRAVSPDEARIFADGIASSLRGANFEAHGLPAGPLHRVSLAVRWHGENAALLWEVDGPPGLRLTSGVDSRFATSEPRGEALLRMSP